MKNEIIPVINPPAGGSWVRNATTGELTANSSSGPGIPLPKSVFTEYFEQHNQPHVPEASGNQEK